MKQKNSLTKLILIMSSIIIFIVLIKNHTVNKFDYCICNDGSISYSSEQGACSSHGGIDEVVYKSEAVDIEIDDIVVILIETFFYTGVLWISLLFLSVFRKNGN